MRVAIATDIYLPQLSGIADSIDTLAYELEQAGHVVRVYAPRIRGSQDSPRVKRLSAWAIPGSAGGLQLVLPWGLRRDLRAFKPDVIHVHMFSTVGFAGARAARALNVPLVGTDHTFPADYLHYLGLGFPPLPTLVRRFAASFYNRCRIVTAPSRSMIDELKAYGLTTATTVISNPIRVGLFRPLDRRDVIKQALGIGPDAVLLFGRVAAEKNLDFAVDVFAAVAAERRAQLVVVGDGPYRAALEKRVAGLGLTPRVRFLGELHGEPLNQALNAADVYLITSKSETQSMTMLQASAAGLPVVAINAGGLPEYVVDGETGYLLADGDKAGFAARIVTLLDDRGLARTVGAKGKEFAARFAPPAIAAAFAAIYAQALPGARATPDPRKAAGSGPAATLRGKSNSA